MSVPARTATVLFTAHKHCFVCLPESWKVNNARQENQVRARLKIRGRCSKKSIKQLNRVIITVSLGLGLVLGLWLVLGLVLGLMTSSDIVLKSTVLSSSCVPQVSLFNTRHGAGFELPNTRSWYY